jgi:magnesium chelatase family protein
VRAREIQKQRYLGLSGIHNNAQMNSYHLREYCRIDESGMQLLKTAMDRLSLSARAYDRILKVARTIADLDASERIRTEPLAEAIQLRSLDRQNRAG